MVENDFPKGLIKNLNNYINTGETISKWVTVQEKENKFKVTVRSPIPKPPELKMMGIQSSTHSELQDVNEIAGTTTYELTKEEVQEEINKRDIK